MVKQMMAYVFCWAAKGRGVWNVDGNPCPVGSDDIVLLRPAQYVGWINDPLEPSIGYSIVLSLAAIPADWPPQDKWPIKRHMPENDIIRPLFEYVVRNSSDVGGKPDKLIEAAVETMFRAFLVGKVDRTRVGPASYPGPVQKVLDMMCNLMNVEPARPLVLADLAAVACVSPEHLCRLFQQHVGYPPMEVLYLYRVTRSLIGLTAGQSVETLANDMGFADASHYVRRFIALFGKSPSEMRELMATGYKPKLPKLPSMGG